MDDLINNTHQIGSHTLLHEYGHAYHWKAIGGPRIDSQDPGCTIHNFTTTETLQCAFSEGFADFFAAWVGGGRLRNSADAIHASDYAIELNPYRTIGNGALNEGAV